MNAALQGGGFRVSDPLSDIETLNRIAIVVKEGRAVYQRKGRVGKRRLLMLSKQLEYVVAGVIHSDRDEDHPRNSSRPLFNTADFLDSGAQSMRTGG